MMDNEWPSLPPDPRLLNLDERLFEIIADHFKPNVDLVAIHLRDARNMLAGVSDGSGFDRAFTKAVIILSAAALESNLAYLSDLTLMIARHRPHLYLRPQLDYLRGTEQYVNDKGDLKTRRVKQRLEEKLKVVPSLLARSMGRKYRLSPRSAAFQLLRRPIELRDVIVHPRWNRYASHVGWYDAAQSIDAVELYLQSIRSQLHPYLSFIDLFLYTIPAGGHKDDTAIAHRTTDQKRRKRRFVPMHKAGVPEIINREWLEAQFLTEFALQSQTEGDSPGSMLTRSALVLLYAMLDAQLALMAEAHLHTKKFSFEPSEALFLSEAAAGVDSDGAISVIESHTHFKQRIVGIPRILARRVEARNVVISWGDAELQSLIQFKDLRDEVMHPRVGSPLHRVSKDELREAEKAVHSYFRQLADLLPPSLVCIESSCKAASSPERWVLGARTLRHWRVMYSTAATAHPRWGSSYSNATLIL